jgi:hypothetical protein
VEQRKPASPEPAKDQKGGPTAERPEQRRDGIQGEGNYEAARAFDKAEREFVASGKVARAARAAAPKSEKEEQEMIAAEEAGRRRAKE